MAFFLVEMLRRRASLAFFLAEMPVDERRRASSKPPNQKIQLAKRRAKGFANTLNFIDMAYFVCGKLKFAYPYEPL
ncbi:hypothetical protein BHU16_02365 [Tannerella sp. oral taxon 808]|nr:hypothetical protein BHU16_02365 [Tannerella sp. oral taxon 808]